MWAREYTHESGECTCACGASLGEAGSCIMPYGAGELYIRIRIGYCMTHDEDSNITYVGRCPYNNLPFHLGHSDAVDLPNNTSLLNSFMCNMNTFAAYDYSVCGQQRCQGMLCGECEAGLGPAVMSYTHPCVECKWYGWLLYVVLSFVPATILCFLIILLRVNVLSPPLNAIVLFTQVITFHVNLVPCTFLYRMYMCIKLLGCLASSHALWSLQHGFFCLHSPPILYQQ